MQEKEEKEVKFEFYNEKLFEFRKNKNLSQEELAEKIGVSRQSIYAWESGKSVPDIENMSKLCQILEIKANDLTNGLNIENDNKVESNNKLEIKKSKLKELKKIIALIFGIIFLIYSIDSMRKLFILEKLNWLQENISYYNNYSYVQITDNTTGSGNRYKLPTKQEIKHKDKCVKVRWDMINSEGNVESNYSWINLLTGEGYAYNMERKTYKKIINIAGTISSYNTDRIRNISNSGKVNDSLLINIINAFTPSIKIKEEWDRYFLEYEVEGGAYPAKIQEYFYKDTGIPYGKWTWNMDNTYISTRYVIDIGTVTDEDVAKPDFTDYRFIESEDEEL